ncbi:MAG: beta-propeller domain-containing protein [Alphaproteobacteria bacterium]|nr:beta-propeller domain-containing protein [Alphaproteobacteria bacterium]
MTRSLPLLALAGVALAGCNRPPTSTFDHPSSLKRFESCDQLRDYTGEVMLESLLASQYGYGWGWLAAEDDAASDGGDQGDGPSDYTTTNVQEAGVDELDLVKTDGNFVYVAQDRALQILSSWPVEDAELLASVPLDGWARGLFLSGDKVVVFEYVYDEVDRLGDYTATRATVFDVSDRADPVQVSQTDISGWLSDARMIGDQVYFVQNHYMPLPEEAWQIVQDEQLPEVDWSLSGDELEADMAQKRDEARRILRDEVAELAASVDLTEILPLWRQDGGAAEVLVDCEDVYRPAEVSQYSMLSVVHLGLDDGAIHATGLMSDGWTLYASVDNLYIAQSSWWRWWGWGDMDAETDIHKFELGDGGEPLYAATTSVPGWLYDQFAMSEYDGYLRVATTDFTWWGWDADEDENPPANNVFVLEDDGAGLLDRVGEVRGIAPNEQIYAVRMIGEVGYVVTFEQVDPLWTLDLSNPAAPEIRGELEMPGFSAYLHPMDSDHLLAVGRHGDMDGNVEGLAINVFDVSDLDNPMLAHQFVLDEGNWSWSEALYDHHAFTFHRGVLSIPAYSYDWDETDGSYDWFSGLLVFRVDAETGIEEIGRVDHRDMVDRSSCIWSMLYDYIEESDCYRDYWYASVRRSIYIEDNLLSVSNYGVKINDLYNPDTLIGEVLFYEQP